MVRQHKAFIAGIPLALVLTTGCGRQLIEATSDSATDTEGDETSEDEIGDSGTETSTTNGTETTSTDDGCPVGTEGCPCTDEGECASGFTCRANICVIAGLPGDGGPIGGDDAGPSLDGGPTFPAPARPSGAVGGAGIAASESFRANIAVGASSAVNGQTQSSSFRLTLGAQ